MKSIAIVFFVFCSVGLYGFGENKFNRINTDHIRAGQYYSIVSKEIDMEENGRLLMLLAISVAKEATDETGFDHADIISNFIGYYTNVHISF